ncbi:uncharacterized protein LOC111027226 isoform X2 [Myzus persicae]|uniref:uncharacterized protein LOC111027226 isoform X2 n=1 Tax=Myzus persicae TaxID=13164 RepID=UPI000B9391C8|nr:uncharacterized protein LOC111027226 isoform X2 [Myzus persicae]
MPSCITCGRSVSKSSKSANITFHKFPSKESVREKWNNFLLENAVSPENVLKTSVICSLHFEQSCFVLDKSRKLLNKHSYPSIIVNRIKGAKKMCDETVTKYPMTYEAKPNSSSNILKCDRKLVKLSCSSNAIEGVSLLDESILNTSSSICSESFSNNKVSVKLIRITN